MSQENVDLVAEGLREFQATLRATERAAADFVWDMSTLEGRPDATEYFGPEGFNEFVAKWTEAYDEFEQRTEEVIDAGDQGVERGCGSITLGCHGGASRLGFGRFSAGLLADACLLSKRRVAGAIESSRQSQVRGGGSLDGAGELDA